MKIHLKTKRNLKTLKFEAYSEILTLILRGKWKIPVLKKSEIFSTAVWGQDENSPEN